MDPFPVIAPTGLPVTIATLPAKRDIVAELLDELNRKSHETDGSKRWPPAIYLNAPGDHSGRTFVAASVSTRRAGGTPTEFLPVLRVSQESAQTTRGPTQLATNA